MKPYRNDSSGSFLLIFSELKQKQLEYSFLLGVKAHSHVNPCSHTTSAFTFTSNIKNGYYGSKRWGSHLIFSFDMKDQRKTQMQTLSVNKVLWLMT